MGSKVPVGCTEFGRQRIMCGNQRRCDNRINGQTGFIGCDFGHHHVEHCRVILEEIAHHSHPRADWHVPDFDLLRRREHDNGRGQVVGLGLGDLELYDLLSGGVLVDSLHLAQVVSH